MAAVLGGTQSLHTNSFDEALALPTPFSAQIARNTQLVLREETGITKVIDPMAGSYYLESLTNSLVNEARKLVEEAEELGGMTKAVQAGVPKLRIEESAAIRQAKIEKKEEIIVGVNKYESDDKTKVDILSIDNEDVRNKQLEKLKTLKSSRNEAVCLETLKVMEDAANDNTANLLEVAINAARARATVGEISMAMEKVFGRHQAVSQSISGVYRSEYEGDENFMSIEKKVLEFEKENGRRPRILVVKLGQDGHDRGAKVIATAFADMGFDVDVGPLFQTPEEAAKQAIENDVHIVGVSTQAAGHKTLVPMLIDALSKENSDNILVVCGGIIPEQDIPEIESIGVGAIFGPGSNINNAAIKVLDLIK
jgi:methylmalonyl-CoA mutase